MASVHQGMGETARNPTGLSLLHDERVGRFALDIAAQLVVGESDYQMRTGMVMQRNHGSGLEFDFGDADAVPDKQNFFGAPVKDVQAAIFVPFCG